MDKVGLYTRWAHTLGGFIHTVGLRWGYTRGGLVNKVGSYTRWANSFGGFIHEVGSYIGSLHI